MHRFAVSSVYAVLAFIAIIGLIYALSPERAMKKNADLAFGATFMCASACALIVFIAVADA